MITDMAIIGGVLHVLVDGVEIGDPVRKWRPIPTLNAEEANQREVLEVIKPDPVAELQQAYEQDGWASAVSLYIKNNGGLYPEAKETVFEMAREHRWTFKQQ